MQIGLDNEQVNLQAYQVSFDRHCLTLLGQARQEINLRDSTIDALKEERDTLQSRLDQACRCKRKGKHDDDSDDSKGDGLDDDSAGQDEKNDDSNGDKADGQEEGGPQNGDGKSAEGQSTDGQPDPQPEGNDASVGENSGQVTAQPQTLLLSPRHTSSKAQRTMGPGSRFAGLNKSQARRARRGEQKAEREAQGLNTDNILRQMYPKAFKAAMAAREQGASSKVPTDGPTTIPTDTSNDSVQGD